MNKFYENAKGSSTPLYQMELSCILFILMINKVNMVNESEFGKGELIKHEFFMDSDNPTYASTYSYHFVISNGCSEIYSGSSG
jgi:hypothetical protein